MLVYAVRHRVGLEGLFHSLDIHWNFLKAVAPAKEEEALKNEASALILHLIGYAALAAAMVPLQNMYYYVILYNKFSFIKQEHNFKL